ncbi:hypothetical protein MRB53_027557 [Persea americana]|uniref:Uncharacterized protein n=1 Tax=Persea americana TaxID=3435 RepID=A0ACC2LMG1_PERAE|nr:hypothetical protein MRB53_027557 [Persea americana]
MHEMAPIIGILLFVFAFDLEIAQPTLRSKTISPGLSLYPKGKTSCWPSPSGHFAFGFYEEGRGFRVGIWLSDTSSKSNKIVVVWTANRDDLPVSANATLVLTHEGELVLKTQDGEAQLIKQLSTSIIHHASMDDNGNFLLYSSDSKIIWQSFDYPTDTILGGQNVSCSLHSGTSVIDHSRGKFVLDFDGYTLALRRDLDPRDDIDIYWTSHGYDGDGGHFKLILDDHGRMSLVTEKGEIMETFTDGWPLGKENPVIYRATLDSDGMFRLYSHSIQENGSFAKEVVKWKEPKDKCLVKGICGFNSYCKLVGDQTDCICLPGFNYTNNPSDRSAGCYMRPWGDNGFRSNTTTLENTTFAVDFYSAESRNKEDCMEACRMDVFCVVALFDYYCYKLKLPLRYGCRNDQTISAVIFVMSASSGNWSTENSTCSTSSSLFKISVILLGVGVTIAMCSCITMAVLGYIFSRRGLWKNTTSSEGKLDSTEDIVLRSFSYNELAAATNGFSEALGRGHFGTVYKGSLTNNERTVVVKKLEKVVEEGEREFHMEMRAIGRTHHKNLTHLVELVSIF